MFLGIQNNLPPLTILSKGQVEEIYQATLKFLENTGVRVLSKQALDILKDAKCKVESNRAFMLSELVEDELRKCPSDTVEEIEQKLDLMAAAAYRFIHEIKKKKQSKMFLLKHNLLVKLVSESL